MQDCMHVAQCNENKSIVAQAQRFKAVSDRLSPLMFMDRMPKLEFEGYSDLDL